jgi:leucyl/phenylalanyl-tRNA--protein transferase
MNRGRITWLAPHDPADAFPDVSAALREPDGLLAVGGDLSVERLLEAYRRGIFPWYENGQPILWWSPDPRCVLWPQNLHVSRRLAQEMRKTRLVVRFNRAFGEVIRACAAPRRHHGVTWITPDIRNAFERLHAEGWAHSVEIWDAEQLVGGLYGIVIGNVFFGESMFSSVDNASKMALVALTRHMVASGMKLLDCQVVSPHLATLGATTLPRAEFIGVLEKACDPPAKHGGWPTEAREISDYAVTGF